jgi:hypothetical protein
MMPLLKPVIARSAIGEAIQLDGTKIWIASLALAMTNWSGRASAPYTVKFALANRSS